ncbi:uncharacterized protein LOC127788628 isoform X2 [Diospyros lotus]|uniref:uncharacterized protein LOC127788628 isoform X2 n=1 Tax=Diospyros lotus TaxID=55363 RepID=UPI002257D7EA|nr:uncharacterized protein LOC127788628 isoform X2 [Diospyros lotus]
MGPEMFRFGVQMRKVVILSIRTCFRSVRNHPFLVAVMFMLFLLYRSFPFLFSLLVSASPVLVCTAILLGTLLSFGQPNIPEIEKEEKVTHEIVSLKTGTQSDASVVERDESFAVERYTSKKRDLDENSIGEASSVGDMVSEVNRSDSGLVYSAALIHENSREIQFEKKVIDEGERELSDSGFERKAEMSEEKLDKRVILENQYSQIRSVEDENGYLSNDRSPVGSIDSRMADRADSTPGSLWKRVDDEEEVDDGSSETGSDRAESSSPDASMADIIPMLDELHPLLDEDVPQPVHVSHDGSDAGSEQLQKSSNGTNESDEDSENHEEEVGDEHDDGDEEEEERCDGKDVATKSAITWTEDDQKNLMDLGTSELERNQRLENLIARRRARRMMTEKNLIDLDSTDLPFNIAPISTIRRNPFDLPYDSNDNMGLPPIPGSAPSILLQRRNPFDIPYDSSEEKPDLTGDSFQQEFTTFAPKEMLFRRHESFNVGPSLFGPPRQEKQEIKLKPYFVAEKFVSEGTSYSSFQRQMSDLSESKVSSVPETDSVCSVGDQDDKKLSEGDFSQEAELMSDVENPAEHVGHGSESSEDFDVVELGQVENTGIEHDELEIKLGDVENHPEVVSDFFGARDEANLGEHDTAESHLTALADEVNYSSRSSSSSLSEVHERIFDEKENEGHKRMFDEKENEVDEKIFKEKENDVSSGMETKTVTITESSISIQSLLEELDINAAVGLVVGSQPKEPVYDLSPQAVQKNLLSSSISSNMQVETSEKSFTPILLERTVSFGDKEPEVSNQSIKMDSPSNNQISVDSSQVHLEDNSDKESEVINQSIKVDNPSSEQISGDLSQVHPEDKYEQSTSVVTEKAEDVILNHGFSRDGQNLDTANASIVPEFLAESVSNNLNPSSDSEAVEDHLIYQDGSYHHEQVPSSSINIDTDVATDKVEGDNVDSVALNSEYKSSGDLTSTIMNNEQPMVVSEQVSDIHPVASSCENECIEEHPVNKEVVLQVTQDQIHSSSSDANFHVGILQDANDDILSTHSESVSEVKPVYELDKAQPSSDKAVVEFSSENHHELDESIIHVMHTVEVGADSNFDASEVQPNEVSSSVCSLLTHEPSFLTSEVSESRSTTALVDLNDSTLDLIENPDYGLKVKTFNFLVEAIGSEVQEQAFIEEEDEIKEIDEGLLVELDSVGDFSVKNLGSNLDEIESNRLPGGEINSEMPLVEARSMNDIDSIFKNTSPLMKIEAEVTQQGQIKEESNSVMPSPETRSLEGVDASCRQISEEETKMPVVVESLNAKLIPEGTQTVRSDHGSSHKDSDMTATEMELSVVEARSIEDIEFSFKQLHNIEGESISSSVDDRPTYVEPMDPAKPNSDLHVERERIMSPVDYSSSVVEQEDPTETNPDLHAFEVRSLEDADMALKLSSNDNIDRLLKSDSEDGSAKRETDEVGSKTTESSTKEPGVSQSCTSTPEPDYGAETSGYISLSRSDDKSEKAKSRKPHSSSSSSSSSSDSV